ncbi:MAG TPA: endopeptidase La, partial [Candidatus Hydrogenedentes bacterium]|nr:endopeptidase La [Candidatus Hydrogenedentota bacterium]
EPTLSDLYRVGTIAKIVNALRLPDGNMKIVVEGLGRGTLEDMRYRPELRGRITPVESFYPEDRELQGKMRAVLHQFEEYVRLTQRVAPEIFMSIQNMTDPDMFTDTVCAFLFVAVHERQALLEAIDVSRRLEQIALLLEREIELARIEQKVRSRVREQIERSQRMHYLQEQLKVIQQELGERDEEFGDVDDLKKKIERKKLPREVREKVEEELARLQRIPFMSPESSVVRGYIDWILDLPWRESTKEAIDLDRAKQILDEDHYGLKKVKERILEYLAVRKLSRGAKGPILCLVGPPGVGKTSLGQSIARAMGRKFVRVSLGGVRDEAEIRGHRRTYVGALPGRILQGMKQAKVVNPVFMLDEVDKMSMDFRGDPSSALLEVLDPAQNAHFSDHYLEVGYDLSQVFFITTANDEYAIPLPLHDRMEIVELPGYTLEEKLQIARGFLIPRQVRENGLQADQLILPEETLRHIIQRYTREAGVRELERSIAALCRKTARHIVEGNGATNPEISPALAEEWLGPPPYPSTSIEKESETGVALGMAWSASGGDLLRIETSLMKGKGTHLLTGRLGEVMKESAAAAFTWIRAHADEFPLPADFYKNYDIHVHVPEGATPKDGPSAGVAILISMLSALTGTPPVPALSMTGEITLRGRVLPVGGIKEKVLAARRSGITRVIMPRENQKDFPDLPEEVLREIQFDLVDTVDQVIDIALPGVRKPKKGGSKTKGAARKRKKAPRQEENRAD